MSPRVITRTVTTTTVVTFGQLAYEAHVKSQGVREPVSWHNVGHAPHWEAAAEAVAVAVEQDIATRLSQALGVPVADLDSLLAKVKPVTKPQPAPPVEPVRPDPIPWEKIVPYPPTGPGLPYFIPPASPVPYVPTRTLPNSDPSWWRTEVICKSDDLVQRIVTKPTAPYDDSQPTFIPSDS